MRKLVLLISAVAVLAAAGVAQACVSAGHGGSAYNCNQSTDTYWHCFVSKDRTTPAPGGYWELSVKSVILPYFQPTLTCNPDGHSTAWIMWHSTDNLNWIQLGYSAYCTRYGGAIYYTLFYQIAGQQPYRQDLWAWPNDGQHTFELNRESNSTNFHPLIDGQQFNMPTVPMPTVTKQNQAIFYEDTNHYLSDTCDKAKYGFTNYDVPSHGTSVSWVLTTTTHADGLHAYEPLPAGFWAADWATPLP